MDRGQIMQVGTPREIYRTPATPFVADFVGLMNFLPGVVAADRTARLRCGGSSLQVSADSQGLTPGREVVVAIRPEDVRILPNGQDLANVLQTSVHEIEFLGPFHRLHLRLPRQGDCPLELTAYLDPAKQVMALQEGSPVSVQLPAEALRVFPTHPDHPPGMTRV